MKILTRVSVLWLPLAVAVTGVFGFAYLATQQNYRQSANDPQIQMAEDAASALQAGAAPEEIVPHGPSLIDATHSLAPWMDVYDASGNLLETNGVLDVDEAHSSLPKSLFDTKTWSPRKTWTAPSGPETHVTWEPRSDVRQAVVLVQYTGPDGVGYVAVGRSLRVVEDRIVNLTELAALVWSITLGVVFVVIWFLPRTRLL